MYFLTSQVKLEKDAVTKITPPRIIPMTLKDKIDKVKKQLDNHNMVSASIPEEVKESTD